MGHTWSYRLLLFFVAVTLLCISCDKMDCNNGLDGQWQMTEWKLPNGDVKESKPQIYYCFQLDMMIFKRPSNNSSNQFAQHISPFENKGSHIVVKAPLKYVGGGHDVELPMSELKVYGVPENGDMTVEELTSDRLVLRSDQYGTLIFRKY